MKDGRPSRIFEIRYFFGAYYTSSPYLEGHAGLWAFGRRLAWFLNGEEFSLGAYPSLYICFSPEIEPGSVKVTDDGGDWWQRYTYVGVPAGFPDREDSGEIAMRGTVAALKAIRPDCMEMIDFADEATREHGETLRFLIGSRSYKRYTLDVAGTISAHPDPSLLIVRLTDRKTGAVAEAQPLPLTFHHEVFDLAGSIRLIDLDVQHITDTELSVKWSPERIGWPFDKDTHAITTSGSNPYFSKRVMRRR